MKVTVDLVNLHCERVESIKIYTCDRIRIIRQVGVYEAVSWVP